MLYHWATETLGWARSIRNRNFPDVHIFVRSADTYRRGYLSDDTKIFKRDSQLICLYGAIDQNLWEHNVLISSWIWVGKTKEGSKQTKNNNRQFAHNTRSSGALKCKFLFSLICCHEWIFHGAQLIIRRDIFQGKGGPQVCQLFSCYVSPSINKVLTYLLTYQHLEN